MAIDINKLLPTKKDNKPHSTGRINIDKLLPVKSIKPVKRETTPTDKKTTAYVPTKPFADIRKEPLPASQKVNYGTLSNIVNVPGGGQYWTDEKMYQTGDKKSYGTLNQKSGYERDHVIPASLGGTSFDPNLQYLKNNKTLLEKIFNKEGQWKNRQEGKMVVELKNIQDFQKGEITLEEARKNVADWNKTPVDKLKDFVKGLIPKKEPFVFKVGEGLTPRETQIAEQVVRKDIKTPGVEIKAPFIQAGTIQPEGGVAEIVKSLIELPEKAAKSLITVPYTLATQKPYEFKKKIWEVKTYQQDADVLAKAVIDGEASLLDAFLLPVTAGADLLFMGSLINSGLKKVAIGAPLTKAEVVASRKALGLADDYTAAQLDKTYKNLIRANHPDIGGNAAIAADINKARTILKADLALKEGNQGLIYNLRRTADNLTKNVQFGVKNIKTPAPEPKLIGEAKPALPTTAEVAIVKPKVNIDKILPKTTPQASVKPQEAITEVLEPKTTKVSTEPVKAEIKAEELVKGDKVIYNGEEYTFVKNYGVSGDRRIIEDSLGNQTPVLPNQITKVGEAKGTSKYGMQHRPTKTGATADNITQEVSEMGLPKDFYDNPGYYADITSKPYQESLSVLRKIKGNPEADVIIYRASPKKELNEGDWVTLSKSYAKGESLAENTPVNSFKVKAKDIQFAGDDINEFGYYPKQQIKAQEKPALPTKEFFPEPPQKKIKENFSSHWEKVKKLEGITGEGVTYDKITNQKTQKWAYDYIQRNPEKSMRLAFSGDSVMDLAKQQALRSSLKTALRAAGKNAQADMIDKMLSSRYTEIAQALNTAKMDLPPAIKKANIRKGITNKRLEKIGEKAGEVDPAKMRETGEKVIKQQTKEATKKVMKQQSSSVKMKEIDNLINSILC